MTNFIKDVIKFKYYLVNLNILYFNFQIGTDRELLPMDIQNIYIYQA